MALRGDGVAKAGKKYLFTLLCQFPGAERPAAGPGTGLA
jgi:hypothetical protein